MRLLQKDALGGYISHVWLSNLPKYAVLSHTWLSDGEEIKYEDIVNGTSDQKFASFRKFQFCANQAAIDGYEHFWIDTCCIDKTSSAEVQEAITAMFQWYRDADRCYVYLADVSVSKDDVEQLSLSRPWEEAFRRSRWFTRGWTLQELLAPATVEFYSAEGILLGNKLSLKHIIHEITNIPIKAIEGEDLSKFSVSERLSWANHRHTTRVEDQAYCLLGIFDLYMPLLYGENKNATIRLQQEIEQKYGELAKWDQLLESLPVAPQAAFNSLDNQHGTTCLTNTRVELLQDIMEWADRSDDKYIYWLNGIAGTGKSTVARTIARAFHEKGILGGSFFFSKGGGDVSRVNLLFTTLARQLASRVSSAKRHICEAIMANKDIALHCLRDQWDQLIINPLAKIDGFRNSNTIIVLDALDEGDDADGIRIILKLMSTGMVLRDLGLRIFITSRPEILIRSGFKKIEEEKRQVVFLHDILRALIDHDLNLFFQKKLATIGEERGLATDWPGSRTIARLVEISDGLFIWASTACRYIREGERFAVKRLDTLIKGRRHLGTGPEKQLDAIYTTVLESLIQPQFEEEEKQIMCGTIKEVVGGIITLFSPLSAASLANLLGREVDKVDETLADLHTILNIPSESVHPIRLHHPTFRDFLFDKNRCRNQDFWVDEKIAHKTLADNCIEIMRKMLRRDICDLKSPGTQAINVDQSCVAQCIPSELQYACLHWAQHYRHSGVLLGEEDSAYLFLKEHYLHWLEVMNLIGKSSEVAAIIRMYQALLLEKDNVGQLKFLKNARTFFFSFQSVMERTPLQIYCTALVFLRPSNELKHHFWNELHPWLKQIQIVEAIAPEAKDEYMFVNDLAFTPDGKQIASASIDPVVRVWDVESKTALFVYNGQRDKTGTVAISPNGKTIVSGSDDASVMVWNKETKVIQFNLEGHTRWVNTVAYSPNGQIIASGSMDETIRLWNANSGVELKILQGNLSCINAITFSPDGKSLASATFDCMVRIWDVSRSEIQLILDGHSGPVNTVKFSPNGNQVVSGSDDMTVKIWNIDSGTESITLKGHLKKVSTVTFSLDARRIVSGSEDKTVRVWDVSQRTLLSTLEHNSGINAVCYSPNGQLLVSSAYNDELYLWDALTGESKGKFADFTPQQLESSLVEKADKPVPDPLNSTKDYSKAHGSAVLCLALSSDQQLVASGSQDSEIKLWTMDGVERAKLVGHSGRITRLSFHPNSHILASASVDSTIILWDVSTGIMFYNLRGHKDAVQDIQFSSDGYLLASCSDDKTIRLWDTISGAAIGLLEGHADTVTRIIFSPDGCLLASCSADTTVRLWDVKTNSSPLKVREGPINIVPFLAEGILVASCSMDSTSRLWHTDDPVGGTIRGHEVNSVFFSPDGKLLVSTLDRKIRIWDCEMKVEVERGEVNIPEVLHDAGFWASHYVETKDGTRRVSSPVSGVSLLSLDSKCTSFVTEDWVMKEKDNVLWLPEQYRATSVATRRSFTALGHRSGSISFISFH